jgi:hypothetical protein
MAAAGGAVTRGTNVAVDGATTVVLVAGGTGVAARAVAISSGVGRSVWAAAGVAGRVATAVGGAAAWVVAAVTRGVLRVAGAAIGAAGASVKEAAGVGGSMLTRVIAGAGTVTRPRTTASIVRSGVG